MADRLPDVHVQQLDSQDCGPTCLFIAARMISAEVSRGDVELAMGHEKGASSLLALGHAAGMLGLEHRSVQYPADALGPETPTPFIAPWRGGHFVVGYRIEGGRVWISDPAAPRVMTVSLADFQDAWARGGSGAPLMFLGRTIEPRARELSPETPRRALSGQGAWRAYLSILGPYLIQLALLSMTALALGLAAPFFARSLIDEGLGRSDGALIVTLVLLQSAVALLIIVVDSLRRYLTATIGLHAYFLLVSNFFANLLALPIRFFDRRPLGDILGRLEDHRRLERFLSSQAVDALFGVSYLCLILTVTSIFAPGAGLIAAGGSAVHIGWVLLFRKWRALKDYQRFQNDAAVRGLEVRTLEAITDVKVCAIEADRRWQWQSAQDRLNESMLSISRLDQVQDGGGRAIHQVTSMAATLVVAWLALRGDVTIGTFVAVSLLMAQLSLPLAQVAGFLRNLQDVQLSQDRIAVVNDGKAMEPIEAAPPAREVGTGRGLSLAIRNLDFNYRGRNDRPVLDGVNLEVPAGQSLAIVGESGSGKSTLARLLLGLYEPAAGSILIDGQPLQANDVLNWRRRCGAVLQEGVLFDGSVIQNIAVGFADPNLDRVHELTEAVGADEFVRRLPGTYHALLGRDGVALSVGQKQRLLVARALYAQPDLLVLDEATSALDAESEHRVLAAIERYARGATKVIIAHRLSTIINAREIAVLMDGRVAETGTHAALLATEGRYRRLFDLQITKGP